MTIREALLNVRLVGFDTSPFIYFVERNPLFAPKIRSVFTVIETQKMKIVTSAVSVTETLMKPFADGDNHLAEIYRELLLRNSIVNTIAVSTDIAERAAQLRARYRLKMPDALHIATAIESGCDAFLTNDTVFKRVDGVRVLILDDPSLLS
ncbi:MAG: PIN domain-containing protein [Chloroflexota bacterium]|nr:PIN domain-containing protein [Chloroflexota bacterium]